MALNAIASVETADDGLRRGKKGVNLMKIGKLRIMTDQSYQNAVALAVRLDQIRRDSMRCKMLDLAVRKNAELINENQRLKKQIHTYSRN